MSALCTHVCAAVCGIESAPAATLPVPSLLPLDFTFVLYDPSSTLSLLLAFATFVPILLVACVFASLVLRRDIEAGYQFGGLLVSTALNHVLKQWFIEHRPVGSAKTGFGMPSDHAQCSAFFVVYTAIWIAYRSNRGKAAKVFAVTLLAASALVIGYSRVHLGVHSVKQVLVGALVGSLLGAVWGVAARTFVWDRIFPLIESSRIGRYFSLKSGDDIPPEFGSSQEFEAMLYRRWKADPERVALMSTDREGGLSPHTRSKQNGDRKHS